MELEVSRENGAFLARTIARLRNEQTADPSISTRCLLIMSMGEATMRLAISVPVDEGREIVGSYKRMTRREITEMLGTS